MLELLPDKAKATAVRFRSLENLILVCKRLA